MRKLHALSSARSIAYARYANIYKDHAAETYANSVEASRRGKGGVKAYRRRVIAASVDAERYRGYDTATNIVDQAHGAGGLSLGPDDETSQQGSSEYSLEQGCGDLSTATPSVSSTVMVVGLEEPEKLVGEAGGARSLSSPRTAEDYDHHRGVASPGADLSSARSPNALCSSRAVPSSAAAISAATVAAVRGGSGHGDAAPDGDTFIDIVPFNNVRAKYMRPWSDTALSRPYRIHPDPAWRATGRSARGPPTAATVCTRAVSTATAESSAPPPTAAEVEGAMEACLMTGGNMSPSETRRPYSRTLTWKTGKKWGGD